MTTDHRISPEIPDCYYPNSPILISPDRPTPKHSLYLSNLDDQKFFRFSVEFLYVYEKAVSVERLKLSLASVLSEYYPAAGRLRVPAGSKDDHKLEVDCNEKGVLFVEAFLDYTSQQLLEFSAKPNKSWEKLIYKANDGVSFLDVPLLVVQVTNLKCGGMVLCISINHCITDGIGGTVFLKSWAHITAGSTYYLSIRPSHNRHILKPRCPPQVTFSHPLFANPTTNPLADPINGNNIHKYLRSQPLVTTSITFNASQVLSLKKQKASSINCTSFEVLAAHTWEAWVRSLSFPHFHNVKLIFSANIRNKLKPEMPHGFFGNGFVLACAESTVKNLVTNNLCEAVKYIQHAKSCLNDDYVRSMLDMLVDKKVEVDLSTTLVITDWTKLRLKDLDFGTGEPLHFGPVSVNTYCRFCPIVKDSESIRVHISLPQNIVKNFEFYMTKIFNGQAKI